MENTISFPTESTSESELLFLASSILLEADRVVAIQTIVAVLLRYVAIGMSVTGGLIEMMAHSPPEES